MTKEMHCGLKGSHSGRCLVCLFRKCVCYETNASIIMTHWDNEIKREK